MKIKFYPLLITALFIGANAMGQTPTPPKPAPVQPKKPAAAVPAKPVTATKPVAVATIPADTAKKLYPGRAGFGFGLNLSSNGPGVDLAKSFGKKGRLAIRVAGNYLTTKLSNMEVPIDKTKLVLNADIKMGSIGAIVDFHPFANAFKISAGYSVIMTELQGTALVKDSVQQGDIMISPQEVGQINIGLTMKPSAYIGLGFGRAVPRKRLGFTFEVGAYYIKQPTLSFKVTGMLEPTSSQESVLQGNLSGLSWLPVVNFGLNFRLGKL